MSSAVLLNRGISFYLFVIVSEIVVFVNALKEKHYIAQDEADLSE